MSADELAKQLGQLVPEVDRSLVNKVLFHLGRDTVERDPTTGKYRLKDRVPTPDIQGTVPPEQSGQVHETVVKQRWKAGGVITVPGIPQWQAIVRDQGHRRGFNIYIMYGTESVPRRVERTKRAAVWEDAKEQAGRLIAEMAWGHAS
jgi:hypothetical protein